jgi:RND family efflux transporter MFP subunit
MNKKIVLAVVIIAFIAGAINTVDSDAKKKAKKEFKRPPAPVETAKAVRSIVSKKLSLFGNVHAGRSATVSAEIQGSVAEFTKEVGDSVKDGESVCQFDDSRYKIELSVAKSDLEKAAASLEKTRLEMERTKKLYKKQIASKEILDENKLTHKIAQAEYHSAKASRDKAKRNLELTSVKAPYAGYLAAKYLQKGDWANVGTEVFDIVDLSSPYVSSNLPEKELGRIQPNAKAKLRLDAYPGEEFEGVISKISPRTSLHTRGFEVRIDFKDPKNLARDGLFARVEVLPIERDALIISKDALVERGSEKIVFRISEGKAQQVNVVVVDQTGDMLEVKGELKEGDEIAVTGNEILRDGAEVNVTLSR